MKMLIINNAEPHDRDYNAPLVDAVARFADTDVVEYGQLPGMQNSLVEYGGVILSGVPVHYDYDTIDARLPYLRWIQEIQVPILGICLGHENIGRLHGAEIIRDIEAEDGLQPLQILDSDPLFRDVAVGAKIFASHRASISVPDGFSVLARTAACQNQVMKHPTRDIYGLQFHPELSEAGIKILGNFAEIVAAQNRAPTEVI